MIATGSMHCYHHQESSIRNNGGLKRTMTVAGGGKTATISVRYQVPGYWYVCAPRVRGSFYTDDTHRTDLPVGGTWLQGNYG